MPASAARVAVTIAAPPETVYRAWLEPERMRTWLAPDGLEVAAVEVDERVGGRVSVWHRDAAGHDVGGSESIILELVPDRRIVLAWRFVGPDRDVAAAPETRLTVTFARTDAGYTRVELVHERLDALRSQHPDIADGVRNGWRAALTRLRRTGPATTKETP